MLPSHKTIKKVFFHYLWSLIESKKTTWEEIKEDFKKDFRTLKAAGISKKDVKKFYVQRQKEIIREKMKGAM